MAIASCYHNIMVLITQAWDLHLFPSLSLSSPISNWSPCPVSSTSENCLTTIFLSHSCCLIPEILISFLSHCNRDYQLISLPVTFHPFILPPELYKIWGWSLFISCPKASDDSPLYKAGVPMAGWGSITITPGNIYLAQRKCSIISQVDLLLWYPLVATSCNGLSSFHPPNTLWVSNSVDLLIAWGNY